jgi:hypothetical protein
MSPHFDGATYDPAQDWRRLTKQLDRVRAYMLTHEEWMTLAEICAVLAYPPSSVASISARLRDLRKEKFGGYVVERRRVPGVPGLYEYRVSKPPPDEQVELFA